MILLTGRKRGVEEFGARALTLIELILVMAVMVIAFALLAPSLGNFFRGRTLDSEARRFLSLSRYARSRAVSEGVPMVLWLDPSQHAYGLAEEFSYSAQDEKAVRYQLATDVELELEVDPRARPPRNHCPPCPGVSPLGETPWRSGSSPTDLSVKKALWASGCDNGKARAAATDRAPLFDHAGPKPGSL